MRLGMNPNGTALHAVPLPSGGKRGFGSSINDWLATRKIRRSLPTVTAMLDPNATVKARRNEIGMFAQGLHWPALRAFDPRVFSRFHTIATESIRDCSQYVPGGPSGGGRDSYDIIDRRRHHDGNIFLRRALSPEFDLQVVAITRSDRYPVARGRHVQIAPNKVIYSIIEDRIKFRISGSDAPASDLREHIEVRSAFAEGVALLTSPDGIGVRSPYDKEETDLSTRVTRQILGDIDQIDTARTTLTSTDWSAPTLKGSYVDAIVTLGINVFIAALIDVFTLSDKDFDWLSALSSSEKSA